MIKKFQTLKKGLAEMQVYMQNKLKETVKKKSHFSFLALKERTIMYFTFTRLPNESVFQILLDYIGRFDIEYALELKVESKTFEEQLFITLQKLKQNCTFVDLAVRYSISDSTVRNIFHTFVSVIHEILFVSIIKGNAMPSLRKLKKTDEKR